MKLFKSLAVVAAFSVATLVSQAAIGAANQLVIGFYATGAANDVELNLGTLDTSATGLLSVDTHSLGNVTTLLNTNFGTDWTGINWAATGGTKLSAGGSEYVTSQWSSTTITNGVLGDVNSANFGVQSTGAVNNGIAAVNSVMAGAVTNNLIGSTVVNSFTTKAPFNMPAVSVVNTLGNAVSTTSGSFSVSDLYLIKGNVDTSLPGVAGVSGFQGTLAVSSTGDITFTVIPEPSTYAIILGALTIGFVALRRRFSRAV